MAATHVSLSYSPATCHESLLTWNARQQYAAWSRANGCWPCTWVLPWQLLALYFLGWLLFMTEP